MSYSVEDDEAVKFYLASKEPGFQLAMDYVLAVHTKYDEQRLPADANSQIAFLTSSIASRAVREIISGVQEKVSQGKRIYLEQEEVSNVKKDRTRSRT